LFGRKLVTSRFWGLSKTENRQLLRSQSLNGDRKLVYTQGGVGARLFRGDKPVREAFSTKSWPEQDGAENIISLEARDFESESGTVTTSRRGLVLGARKPENPVLVVTGQEVVRGGPALSLYRNCMPPSSWVFGPTCRARSGRDCIQNNTQQTWFHNGGSCEVFGLERHFSRQLATHKYSESLLKPEAPIMLDFCRIRTEVNALILKLPNLQTIVTRTLSCEL
jgi:hypothetical protein